MTIATTSHLVKMVRQTSGSTNSTPGHPAGYSNPFIAPHPHTPAGVVILVAEIMNLLLSSALLSPNEPDQRVFAKLAEVLPHVPSVDEHGIPHVPAEQTGHFVDGPLASGPGEKFVTVPGGQDVLEETERRALRWWSEVMGPGDSYNEEGRKGSLFSVGGGEPDEEVELSVAILVSEHEERWMDEQYR